MRFLGGVGAESGQKAIVFEWAQANGIAAAAQSEGDTVGGIGDEAEAGGRVAGWQAEAGLRQVEIGERNAAVQLAAVEEEGVCGEGDVTERIPGERQSAKEDREESGAGDKGGEQKVVSGEVVNGGESGGGGRKGEGEGLAPIVTTGKGGEFEDGDHGAKQSQSRVRRERAGWKNINSVKL